MESSVTAVAWWAHWRLDAILVAGTAVALYLRGTKATAAKSRPIFFLAIALFMLAMGSPLNYLATRFFSLRVVQHLLLVALIPCLFFFSEPLHQLYAGLPPSWQQVLAQRHTTLSTTAKARLYQLTAPGVALMLTIACFWVWYDPHVHAATLRYGWLHWLETWVLLTAACFYWWHIMAAAPHIHTPLPPLVRICYTIVGTWPIKIVGFILLALPANIYNYPQNFQLTGLAINDQTAGAIIVWALGGIVFSTTATVLMRTWLGDESSKPVDPHPAWQTDEAMRAPGF